MKPRVFVSSTFYDLKYIRDDIGNFIKMHDFEPILFEDGDIGYTPGKNLDSSCYKAMKSADMVILIIGGEYGSPATGEKKDDFEEYISITRKEFRSAINTGVPIYVFIESSVYHEYDVYDINCENIENKKLKITFKSTKNLNVFRFIKEIKTLSNNPIQEFRFSSDIKSFLSKQWSDMFKKYLELLKQEKEDTSLQSTVVDIKSLIEQMSIMIDAMGQKVIKDKDQTQYKSVIQQQNSVEAKRIVNSIVNGLKIRIPEYSDKKSNIKVLLDSIMTLGNKYETTVNEQDSVDISDIMLNELFLYFQSNNLFLKQVKLPFADSIIIISKSLKDRELHNLVSKKLQLPVFYNKIFSTDYELEELYN